MSKKKSFKKRSKKVSTRQTGAKPMAKPEVSQPANMTAATTNIAKPQGKKSVNFVLDPTMVYVAQDVKRIGIIVSGFIIFQLILFYLLNNTSLGPSVYNLIKI